MKYQSTRDSSLRFDSAQVIAQGISHEGGLFVPTELPDLRDRLPALLSLDYRALAKVIFSYFLTDFSKEEIAACVDAAYSPEKFGGAEPVKLKLPQGQTTPVILELWHGPTCAFKDMALQILPQFLTRALQKSAPGKEAVILTATSGDTGKAALEGFKDVPGTSIIVFYPRDGVSPMQKRQMVTQEGENVSVCAVEGNFDDAQTAVKQIFTDPQIGAQLSAHGKLFSSANSINWGRLLPQIVYYFYAYASLCRSGAVQPLESVNIAVPTGNFGNILAAYYAKEMGLPVKTFLCASNQNKVLTDFIRTGVYDKRREFFATTSPSMDILVSSNLERLLFALYGKDCTKISRWMEELSATGAYTVDEQVKHALQESFYGGFCNDDGAADVIARMMQDHNYLIDPHTAVAVGVYAQYVRETGDATPTILASTASPYKFAKSVLSALGSPVPEDEFEAVRALEELSQTEAPAQLRALKGKAVRFSETVPKTGAADFVLQTIGIGG